MTLLSSLVASLAVLSGMQAAAAFLPKSIFKGPPRKTLGCDRAHFIHAGTGWDNDIRSNGVYRKYRVHLPESYTSKRASPLLVAFHGSGGKPRAFEKETHFSDKHVNPDMIVVYPAGLNNSWQGALHSKPDADDVLFTADLVARVKEHYCIDESRVYATGHSAGAGFTDVLACSPVAEQFAAFAPVSGAFYQDSVMQHDCEMVRTPLPMLEIHGGADKQSPYVGTGSEGPGSLPSITDWVDAWTARNDCDAPVSRDPGHGVQEHRFTCRGVVDAVEHIKVDGMGGSSWPKPESLPLDVSRKVVEFFNKHRRPRFGARAA